jgi:hypothetical protein
MSTSPSTPSFFSTLAAAPSAWKGESILEDPGTGQPETSASAARISPVLRGSFLRLDYTWAYQGSPEEGTMLIGHDPDAALYTLHWGDTWHMSRKIMLCEGKEDPASQGQRLTTRGTWSADGETWGWKIELTLTPGPPETLLHIVMHNLTPSGVGSLAVTGKYTAYLP